LYEWNGKLLRVFQRFVVRGGKIGKVGGALTMIAPPLGAWTKARDLRPIEANTFREQWREMDGFRGD
jgi:hypothetical protein